ncbi:MAG: hypothetical protein ACTSP4_14505 [Candidatus Hodarchaeales archaeon]
MKKKLGGFGKGLVKDAASQTFNTVLNTVIHEIIEETKVKEIAKEQIIEAGKKILKDDSIPTKEKIQKEILKKLIKQQLGL